MEKLEAKVEGDKIILLVGRNGEPLALPNPTAAEARRTEKDILETLGGFKKKGRRWERELEDGVVLKIALIEPGHGNKPESTVACVILSRFGDGFERPLAAFEFSSVPDLLNSLSLPVKR